MNPNHMKFRRSKPEGLEVEVQAVDLKSMKWQDLLKLAKDRGVYSFGMKRVAIEAALS